MSNMFDDLFEKFFGRKPKNKKIEPQKNEFNDGDFVSKLMKSIEEFQNLDDNFGPPTRVEYYEENGVYYKKDIWKINGGEMVHLVGSLVPFKREISELSYEEQLAIALENEEYEKAAILRDKLINK